jgi:hypothetical protein
VPAGLGVEREAELGDCAGRAHYVGADLAHELGVGKVHTGDVGRGQRVHGEDVMVDLAVSRRARAAVADGGIVVGALAVRVAAVARQWWKKPATGASTSVIVNAKLFVPDGTLYQCSVGAWFFPLQPEPAEPGPPNSALTGSQPSSVKSGLTIVNGWKVAADACAPVPVSPMSETASSAAPPTIRARSLRYMKNLLPTKECVRIYRIMFDDR